MTTITPVKFYPPKTEGWSHNIKAADGFYYGCPEKFITLFQINQPIEVEITIKEKDGKTYRDIKRVIPNGNGQPGTTTPTRPTPIMSQTDPRDERIYVAGIVNNWVSAVAGTHKINTAELIAVTNAARAAWSETFGKKDEAA